MPKVVDHEARRELIARAFFRVIVDKGIEGATTREIAREAGVSLGVLAHYFGDKERLVVGAFDVLVAQFTRRLTAAARAQATPEAALEALCLETLPLDAGRRLESGVWMSFWAHGYSNEAVRRRQQEEYAGWTRVLAGLMARLRPSAAGLDDPEVRAAAATLAALLDGLTIHLMLRDPAEFPPEQAVSVVRRHVRSLGVGASAGRPHA